MIAQHEHHLIFCDKCQDTGFTGLDSVPESELLPLIEAESVRQELGTNDPFAEYPPTITAITNYVRDHPECGIKVCSCIDKENPWNEFNQNQ